MTATSSFLDALRARGLLYQHSEGLAEHLAKGPVVAYCGFDPTAVSLHVGNLVPDRKSTRLNSSHLVISYAVFCLKKKKHIDTLFFVLVIRSNDNYLLHPLFWLHDVRDTYRDAIMLPADYARIAAAAVYLQYCHLV